MTSMETSIPLIWWCNFSEWQKWTDFKDVAQNLKMSEIPQCNKRKAWNAFKTYIEDTSKSSETSTFTFRFSSRQRNVEAFFLKIIWALPRTKPNWKPRLSFLNIYRWWMLYKVGFILILSRMLILDCYEIFYFFSVTLNINI